MQKAIKIGIWFLGIICLYAVIQIQLGIFWNIGISNNADKINSVLLNLSYSYIAGLIMYALTIELPTYIYRKKIRQIIKQNIENVGICLHNLLVGFPNKEGRDDFNPDISDIEYCESILTDIDWNAKNILPIYNNIPNKLFETFYYDYSNLQKLITSFLQVYKTDLTAEQLLLLEGLVNMRHMQIIEVIINSRSDTINNRIGNSIAKEYAEKLQIYANLKSTI